MNTASFKTCVFGASPGTGNQGVDALCWSTLNGLAERGCTDLHVFGFGAGTQSAVIQRAGDTTPFQLHGFSVGRGIWRSNHLGRARIAAAAGLRRNALLHTVADADLVVDVSGGDSFTDLYGSARFQETIAPKEIALRLGRELVLLPQTYGPFRSARSRNAAQRVIGAATLAYARDPDSFMRLRELMGERFDPARHREGVDLAFGLQPHAPGILEPGVARLLHDRGARPLIGLNVSGLIANRPDEARVRFGLAGDYLALMRALVMELLDTTDANLLLIPHVHAPSGHYESDLDACRALLRSLPQRHARAATERVAVVTAALDACELKWLVARTDWFCGTRMHATIAALSSGVPTAALAYSLKTSGVFASCGMADAVVDLRTHAAEAALEQLLESWRQRAQSAAVLMERLPGVLARAGAQLDEIVAGARKDRAMGALPC
jgi:polysaccharide pyruvyl transferase WcaK-like protein